MSKFDMWNDNARLLELHDAHTRSAPSRHVERGIAAACE